ncbi:efflux RND transporter permease subunit [Comamonas testosteroni]|uniref:efflux RND transporter permease subunit n=1 Tax=Comamonas testosteroni TaxID=285 RepID=UPI0005B3DA78|nr:efflux RND transporter permease subunit [Comamonas testosteroni]
MKLRISAWAILNPIPVTVLFFFLIAVGVIGYRALPVKLYPDTSFPVVQVSVTLPDAAVTEVEKQVTRVVEGAVSNVPGVKHVTSSVSLGSSSTMVEFEIGQNAQKVTEEVRSAIDRIRSALPSSVPPPIVEKADFDSVALVTYAVSSSSMSDVDLTWFIEDTVGRKLLSVNGVGQVKRIGGVERDVTVTLDLARMQSRGLTAVSVNDALKSFQTDNAGGRSEIGGREQTMRVLGTSASVEALSNMVVATPDGRDLRLKDVATVFSGASDRRGYATLDESPVVGFQVMKTKASSDVNVEQGVKRALEQLSWACPNFCVNGSDFN